MIGFTFGPTFTVAKVTQAFGIDLVIPLLLIPVDDKLEQEAVVAPGIGIGVSLLDIQKSRPQFITLYGGLMFPVFSQPDDALIAAKLPEYAPDGAYKTTTVLNLDDALWGTMGLGRSRLEESQRNVPHAFHVLDEKGVARAAWDLKPKSSAVIVLDRDGTVLFFKEGKLNAEEISRALGIIKEKLGLK